MQKRFPRKAVIVTEKASFHLTISPYVNRNTNTIDNYTISLGSRNQKCIQLNVPSVENTEQEGVLIWVEKIKPVCTLKLDESSNISQYALNLAFTIAKDINPHCIRYILDDDSRLNCDLPDNKKERVSMKSFHIAFHGSTWYEKHFGAKLIKGHNEYVKLKENLYTLTKPTKFDFKNAQLQQELQPLYENTNTWYDFFQVIQEKYKDKKCAAIYPWIRDALMIVFENNYLFEYPKWYIDITNLPHIAFRSYEDVQKGGGKTRRHWSIPTINEMNPMHIAKMNYNKFLTI